MVLLSTAKQLCSTLHTWIDFGENSNLELVFFPDGLLFKKISKIWLMSAGGGQIFFTYNVSDDALYFSH